ncbi:RING finger protein 122 isoform X2 [Motacilla alba alba]|uniref:RING finger protein 122 isoform X2 n=1 Tax=Motacilla alba alba TaxID=1094192 RepID=UPI0018D59AAF|nr:RING finger protein 122 isoform X2 [Motacilla alba alba]
MGQSVPGLLLLPPGALGVCMKNTFLAKLDLLPVSILGAAAPRGTCVSAALAGDTATARTQDNVLVLPVPPWAARCHPGLLPLQGTVPLPGHRTMSSCCFLPARQAPEGTEPRSALPFFHPNADFLLPPGCSCSLGLVYASKPCTMPPITFQDLPLNIYMLIFGTGIFIFLLSLIFCCYFIGKLRHQAQSERFGYKEVKPGVPGLSGDTAGIDPAPSKALARDTLPGTPRAHPAPARLPSAPPGAIPVGNPGGKSRWEIVVGNPGGKSRWEIPVGHPGGKSCPSFSPSGGSEGRRPQAERARDLRRLPGGFSAEGGAGGAAVPARLPQKVPADVAGGSLRVPHVQPAPQAAPRRHRDPPGRAAVRRRRGCIPPCGTPRDPPCPGSLCGDPRAAIPPPRPRLGSGFVLVRAVLPVEPEFPAGS